MLPVPGELPEPGLDGFLGIGTALAVNFLMLAVGSAADATAGRPRTAREPSKARQVDALRISFLSSVDGQVRLDPGSSGAYAGPAISRSPATRRRTVATSVSRLSIAADRRK